MEHAKLDRTCRRDDSAPPVGLVYTQATLQWVEKILVSACAVRLSRPPSDHCCRRSAHHAVNGKGLRSRTTRGGSIASRFDVQTAACAATVPFAIWTRCKAIICAGD